MPEVRLEVYAETHGAPQALKQTEDALAGVERGGGATSGSLKNLWVQFALGDMASRALSKGLSLAKEQVVDSIKAAMESEKANKSLEAALEITGRGTAQLGEHFKSYADELMKATVYDDEAIKGAQALLVQLTNLDKDGIDKATRGAIGLASVFKMDLSSAAEIVTKAMAGNVAGLGRYGIKVAENLPLEEKRAALLMQLEKLFGRATAETGTFGGQLTQLKNRWGEVQEAAGGFITQQKGVIQILNAASQSVLDYLTMDEMLAKATGRQVENENRLADRLGKAAAAANWQYGEMARLIEAYGGITPALIVAITHEEHGIAIKQAYVKALQDERLEWEKNEAARKKAEKGTNDLTTAHVKLIETGLKPGSTFADIFRANLARATVVIEDQLPAVNKLSKEYLMLLREAGLIKKANPWDETLKSIQAYSATGGAALSALDAVFQQGTQNRMTALDNEYNKRLAHINASITDEAARQQAISKLDDEFAAKRKAAAHALGLSTKAVAISNAIISTHEAAAKAMAQGGFILGIPWATIIEALGWAQVGLIAAQPIPLAKGGYFDKPTLLPRKRDFLIGEASPEIASPVPVMRQIVREELRAAAKEGSTSPIITINVKGPLALVSGAREQDFEKAGPAIYKALAREFRLRGQDLLRRS